MHVRSDDIFQAPDLQITNALWQPRLALTCIARALLVDQYGVSWPRTLFAYAEIFGGVYSIVFEQSFVNHYQYLKEVRSPLRIFTLRFFFKNALVIYALRFREFLQTITLVIVTFNIIRVVAVSDCALSPNNIMIAV